MNDIIPFRRRLIQPFWESISSMEREFNKLFNDQFFSDAFTFSGTRTSTLPKVNIKELKDGYNVEIAIPGLDKDDINIELSDNKLYIEGKKTEKTTREDESYIFREIGKRAFHRVIPFPKKIDEEKISAKYEKGIIEVKIKKKEVEEKKKVKKVKIN